MTNTLVGIVGVLAVVALFIVWRWIAGRDRDRRDLRQLKADRATFAAVPVKSWDEIVSPEFKEAERIRLWALFVQDQKDAHAAQVTR